MTHLQCDICNLRNVQGRDPVSHRIRMIGFYDLSRYTTYMHSGVGGPGWLKIT